MGVLQALLQSRRMTEGSIRQSSVASLVQGYMEQIKSMKYASDFSNALPSSPATSPGTTLAHWQSFVGLPIIPVKDSNQANIFICLATGNPPASTATTDFSTLPTDASRLVEAVDIDNSTSTSDDSTLYMWVWIKDMTVNNVADCKSITIAYQWTVKNGGQTKTYNDMTRTIRSVIPTS